MRTRRHRHAEPVRAPMRSGPFLYDEHQRQKDYMARVRERLAGPWADACLSVARRFEHPKSKGALPGVTGARWSRAKTRRNNGLAFNPVYILAASVAEEVAEGRWTAEDVHAVRAVVDAILKGIVRADPRFDHASPEDILRQAILSEGETGRNQDEAVLAALADGDLSREEIVGIVEATIAAKAGSDGLIDAGSAYLEAVGAA